MEAHMGLIQRIGSTCLAAALLLGMPGSDSVWASADADQKGDAAALTIYNQQFAVVREKLPLDLHSGV